MSKDEKHTQQLLHCEDRDLVNVAAQSESLEAYEIFIIQKEQIAILREFETYDILYERMKGLVGDSRAAADYAIWRFSPEAPTSDRCAVFRSFCKSNDCGYHETTENFAAVFKPSSGV